MRRGAASASSISGSFSNSTFCCRSSACWTTSRCLCANWDASTAATRARAFDLLSSLDIAAEARKAPEELSGGQRQRVAIARALANDPRFVLADEPTGALDTKNGAAVFAIFRRLADEGRTVIVVTHDEGLARLTQRAIHIVDGRVAT